MSDPALSLIVPVYNEQESLAALHEQIGTVARERELDIEIVFIDDGSRDGSWDVVKELAGRDSRVRGIRFRRNFGKAAALNAGFREARGARALTLDADLQDDPAEIPNFLAELGKGFDVVSGWKKVRHDPWHKVLPSRVFNGMVSWLTGVKLHDHNCGMKAYNGAVLREVRLYGEFHRFVPVLAAARGFRVGELVIQHRPRKFGHSKYGFKRFLRGFLDLLTVKFLTTYGRRPMHLFGGWALFAGVVMLAIAVLGLIWWPMLSALTLLGIVLGVLVPLHLFLHGLQAELIVSTRTDDPFSIVERVGFSESSSRIA
jgi:dolichol-phosphate mannosyltransferase